VGLLRLALRRTVMGAMFFLGHFQVVEPTHQGYVSTLGEGERRARGDGRAAGMGRATASVVVTAVAIAIS